MAIRYSGDTEVRLRWRSDFRAYQGSVRDPYKRWEGMWIPQPYTARRKRNESEAYDRAAIELIRVAQRWAKSKRLKPFEVEDHGHGRVRVRRVYQAPCPT